MTSAPPSPSGLPAVDRQWGGFAPGRAYLLVGRAGAGRSALALQAARAAIGDGQRCLVISPRPPEALVEIGRGIGLDLAAAHGAGQLRLLRIPSAQDLAARGPEGLAQSYRDLAGLAASDRPSRVVIEDFTPLVQFDTFERFRDAFSGLLAALRAQGATLVIGLGDPANEASRQLLDVVEGLVDGTIRLGAGGDVVLGLPAQPAYPSNDGGSAEALPRPTPAPPAAEAPASPSLAPPAPPAAQAPAPSFAPPAAASPAAAPPAAAPPSAPWTEPPAPPRPAGGGFETTFAESAGPPPAAPHDTGHDVAAGGFDPSAFQATEAGAPAYGAPAYGAPSPTAPSPAADSFPAAQEAPAAYEPPGAYEPPAAFGSPAADGSSAPGASGPGGPPSTEVVPPPPPDPSLLTPTDAFAFDPADALMEQGFLADSTGGEMLPVIGAQMPTAAPHGALPSFTSLGSAPAPPAAPDQRRVFRSVLHAAFAERDHQMPFVTVALRMDPAAPQALHFGAVEEGLRSSLRTGDALCVDPVRKRAAVVLPRSMPETAQALFAGLQAHLRKTLGAEAEAVLQSVAAVTIADGQPFQTADELMGYAFDG